VNVAIDWTISVGNILTLLTLIAGIIGLSLTHVRRVDHLEIRVDGLKLAMEGMAIAIKQVADVLTAQRVFESRLDRVEQDVRELRHGEGYVLPLYSPPAPPST
jgi:hypothetical protein